MGKANLAAMEAFLGRAPTHELVQRATGDVLFRGTLSQCQHVKDGYDWDMRRGHRDAKGATLIRPLDK